MKNKKFLLKIAVSAALLAFLFIKIELKDIIDVVSSANPYYLLLTVPLVVLIVIVRTYKWEILLKSAGIKASFRRDLKALLIGMFYGMMTPGKAGELARVFYISEDKAKTLPTILWDRLNDILALLLLSNLAVFFLLRHDLLVTAVLLADLGAVVGLVAVSNRKLALFLARLTRIRKMDEYALMFLKVFDNLGGMLKAFFFSLLFYFLNIVAGLLILKSFDSSISWVLALCFPVIVLFGNIPITVSGLGVREAVSVYCFSLFNVDASIGFSYSLLLFIITSLVPGILGYLFFIKK